MSSLLASAGLALLPRGGRAAPLVAASLILRGGRVLTMDPAGNTAQAVAIGGNRILAVGRDADIAGLANSATRIIDLKGATVIPGLRDSHLHTLGAARDIFNVPLEDARDLGAINEALRMRVAASKKGEWVLASSGWHEGQIVEARMPTRQELDRISPDNPVFIPRGGHVAVVNSAALAVAGITRDTPDPKGGVIVRDSAGEPTGFLVEGPAMKPGAPPAAARLARAADRGAGPVLRRARRAGRHGDDRTRLNPRRDRRVHGAVAHRRHEAPGADDAVGHGACRRKDPFLRHRAQLRR